jgi:hypothetical protein
MGAKESPVAAVGRCYRVGADGYLNYMPTLEISPPDPISKAQNNSFINQTVKYRGYDER